MPKRLAKDVHGQISDNNKQRNLSGQGKTNPLPINRNLSLKLFGQLGNLIDKTN